MDRQSPQAGPSTPPAEEWQAHWARTVPQLQALSRCALAAGARLSPQPLLPARQQPGRGQPRQPPHPPCCPGCPRRLGSAAGAGAGGFSIMRSSQLDAERLDQELTGMLREQFMRSFALFQPVRGGGARWWVGGWVSMRLCVVCLGGCRVGVGQEKGCPAGTARERSWGGDAALASARCTCCVRAAAGSQLRSGLHSSRGCAPWAAGRDSLPPGRAHPAPGPAGRIPRGSQGFCAFPLAAQTRLLRRRPLPLCQPGSAAAGGLDTKAPGGSITEPPGLMLGTPSRRRSFGSPSGRASRCPAWP